MTLRDIREFLRKWWKAGDPRSRAKDDYLELHVLNLGITELFPRDEDELFVQIDQGDF